MWDSRPVPPHMGIGADRLGTKEVDMFFFSKMFFFRVFHYLYSLNSKVSVFDFLVGKGFLSIMDSYRFNLPGQYLLGNRRVLETF